MSKIPKIGEIFDGKYEILEILGSGGIGTVFKALQLDCKRILALKILHEDTASDEEYRARFVREAQALSQVRHQNIVNVYHLGISPNEAPYMTMEYVAGKTIRAILNSLDRMPVIQSLMIIRDAALALSYVHKQGIVHRDLKPENILIVQSPDPDTVKLVDFGLARVSNLKDQKLTCTGELIGTCSYMSPEQCKAQPVDFRSDIYSLSACLYEMIVGDKPFTADTSVGLMYKHINEPVPIIISNQVDLFHPSLNEIVSQGMSKVPQQRFGSMEEMAKRIDDVIADVASLTSGGKTCQSVRSLKAIGLCLMLLLAIGVIGGFKIWQDKNRIVSEGMIQPKTRANEYSMDKERRLKDSLARSEKSSGPDSPNVAAKLFDLVAFYKEEHNYKLAEPLFKRLLRMREKAFGHDSLQVADVLIDLAQIYSARGDYVEAERFYKRALAIREKSLGSDHLRVAYVLSELAQMYSIQRNFIEAEPVYKRSLAIYEKANHPNLSSTVQDLASCYRSQGKLAEADKLEARAKAIKGPEKE